MTEPDEKPPSDWRPSIAARLLSLAFIVSAVTLYVLPSTWRAQLGELALLYSPLALVPTAVAAASAWVFFSRRAFYIGFAAALILVLSAVVAPVGPLQVMKREWVSYAIGSGR